MIPTKLFRHRFLEISKLQSSCFRKYEIVQKKKNIRQTRQIIEFFRKIFRKNIRGSKDGMRK